MASCAFWRTKEHSLDNDRPTGEDDHERTEHAWESGQSRGGSIPDLDVNGSKVLLINILENIVSKSGTLPEKVPSLRQFK
jgi:hypothetical protein